MNGDTDIDTVYMTYDLCVYAVLTVMVILQNHTKSYNEQTEHKLIMK